MSAEIYGCKGRTGSDPGQMAAADPYIPCIREQTFWPDTKRHRRHLPEDAFTGTEGAGGE